MSYGIGDIPAGTPHPDNPGCLWEPQIGEYICDDGYTVHGDPYFTVTGTSQSSGPSLLLIGGFAAAAALIVWLTSK